MHEHGLGPNSAISRLPEIKLFDKDARTYTFDLYLVDMARVYKEGKEDMRLIGENTVKEMFHTAVGLLSVSLVSMDKTTIYEALFEKSSVTIFIISRDDDCTGRLMETNSSISKNKKNQKAEENVKFMAKLREAFHAVSSKSTDDDDDAYESGTEEASDFGLVFASDISSGSDGEESDEEDKQELSKGTVENKDDDDNDTTEECCDDKTAISSESCSERADDDEDTAKKCSHGYHSFLASCLERKLKVKEVFLDKNAKNLHSNDLLPLLGPENRIAAVCNFRARKVDNKKRVIHITFLSVKKHLRRLGIGTRIIDIIKTPQMSGLYDAMVVHADLNATEFFARNGFSGDPLLNKQWASFANEYVNCLLMTYFPPLSFGSPITSSSKLIQSIDKSIDKWLVDTGNVHQMQYTLCKRLRAEVLRLQNQLLAQDSLVQVLKREVVKQAHIIEELRRRLQKCGGDADASTSDPDTITFTMLPPPLGPDAQLSMCFNGVTLRDCAGDMDVPSFSPP
ncbi:unnamed protein product [Hydatigera taeniaeformis]|uniref:N-acetyltransferase domain-containing protein n=1 Tax=Hydatigena taeniaeformis TaxID=6205 RepID=A0A0R3WJ34_HYDTA|nr:unnamed protein product [Hydatigera taeniaeformis]